LNIVDYDFDYDCFLMITMICSLICSLKNAQPKGRALMSLELNPV
jgi:hypothetical protein